SAMKIGMRRRLAALTLVVTILLAAAASSQADLIFFKDGYAVQGQVKRDSTVEVDPVSKQGFYIPRGPFWIEDGPRKYVFSRHQVVDFMAQAGWLGEAANQLDRIARDFPEQKEEVEKRRANLDQLIAREEVEEIKRRHAAGQFFKVKKMLAEFPEKKASAKAV